MQATQGTLLSLPSVCPSPAFPTRSQSVCPAPASPSHFDRPPQFPPVYLLQHLLSVSHQLRLPHPIFVIPSSFPICCPSILICCLSVPFPLLCLVRSIPTVFPSRQAGLQGALLLPSFSQSSFSFSTSLLHLTRSWSFP